MKTTTKSLLFLAMCLMPHLVSGQAFGDKAAQPPRTVLHVSQVTLLTPIDEDVKVLWLEGLIFTCISSAAPLEGIFIYTRAAYTCGLVAYEALAPFTDGLKGFLKVPDPTSTRLNQRFIALSDVLRQTARDENSKRIAMLHAAYKVFVTLWPRTSKGYFDGYMEANQLRQNGVVDMETMDSTPKGIGNQVGARMIEYLINDGANQLGDRPGITYNRIPYSDYLRNPYTPVHGCEKNRDITRWQPLLQYSESSGLTCQTTLPTWSQAKLLTGKPIQSYRVTPPSDILNGPRRPAFMAQVRRVIDASARLNDTMKCTAESVDSKIVSLGRESITNKYKLNLDQQVMLIFAQFAAVHDGDHGSTYFKLLYDNARPISIIRNCAGGLIKGNITAWAGPFLGTRSINPREWRQFNRGTHAGPDSPSGATTDFTAVAVLQKLLLKNSTDPDPSFNWQIICPKGWSEVEPGFAPSKDTFILIDKAEEMIQWVKNGREWGGIHHLVATNGGEELGRQIGADLYTRFTTEFGWNCGSIGLGTGESVFRCPPRK